MSRIKALILKKESVHGVGVFLIFLTISTLTPLIRHQAITGTIVNAMLFITVTILGTQGAFLIATLPSIISLAIGFLPIALLPMVPFIITSNVLLVFIFKKIKKVNYWGKVFIASFVKFLLLFSASSIIIKFFIREGLAKNIIIMMSWPQLLTAIGGGILAFLVLRITKKINARTK